MPDARCLPYASPPLGDADLNDDERLATLLRSKHPAIALVTHDEPDALNVVLDAAKLLQAQVWTWTALDGVRDHSAGGAIQPGTENAAAGLYWLRERGLPAVYVLIDVGSHVRDDVRAMRALRELIHDAARAGSHVVLIDHAEPPDAVKALAMPFQLSLPAGEAIERIVRATLKRLHAEREIKIDLTVGDYRLILKNLAGLSKRQIEQVVCDVVAEDRRFDAEDLNRVLTAKRRMVSAHGHLEVVESPASLDDVGGLSNLKRWLEDRRASFGDKATEYGLTPPRGVLLLGVQGAGKSLCAKAIATAWQRPLLRLDAGALYNSFVGESERRLRDALQQAEATAPVVLWIDEIEKAFASAATHSTDGGLSQRMFGTLLTWMQDHDKPVFLVATANNIEALPPELLRKGRFDEIFFVDLPETEARKLIFEIHLRKRKRDPEGFDTARLAELSAGFSGAEIEQAVVAAMHQAFNAGSEPTTETIADQLERSPPLSVTMAERIERLRAWASGRCVPAG